MYLNTTAYNNSSHYNPTRAKTSIHAASTRSYKVSFGRFDITGVAITLQVSIYTVLAAIDTAAIIKLAQAIGGF